MITKVIQVDCGNTFLGLCYISQARDFSIVSKLINIYMSALSRCFYPTSHLSAISYIKASFPLEQLRAKGTDFGDIWSYEEQVNMLFQDMCLTVLCTCQKKTFQSRLWDFFSELLVLAH